MQPQSPKFTFNWEDTKSLLITALLFGVAAVITYILDHLTALKLDENQLLIVQLFLGTALKFLQKFLDGPKR